MNIVINIAAFPIKSQDEVALIYSRTRVSQLYLQQQMENEVSSKSTQRLLYRVKPFLAVIFLQFGFAGMDIFSKVALNHGGSNYVLVVYRHAIATVVIAPFAVILDRSLSLPPSLPLSHTPIHSDKHTNT